MVITIEQDKGRYAALCILLLGSYITPSLTMAWLSGNTPGEYNICGRLTFYCPFFIF